MAVKHTLPGDMARCINIRCPSHFQCLRYLTRHQGSVYSSLSPDPGKKRCVEFIPVPKDKR